MLVAGLILALWWFEDVEWARVIIGILFVGALFVMAWEERRAPFWLIEEEAARRPAPAGRGGMEAPDGPSKDLRKAIGPIAKELHSVEEELLEQTRHLDGPQLVALSCELTKMRAELVNDVSPEPQSDSGSAKGS